MTLSHFSAVLIYAVFASVVFGITQRATPRAMIRYGLFCWVLFAGSVILASWLMYFIRH
ncbi:hypothetical protein [Paracidobacterium acidisoli]|uniref:hypothetical protein n=1 Tax=Paracidobacterium acidisoli TaxID=2303751 RepID=UPI0018F1102D|nr:hypothetical protein [Paracidobacterium acidisoli]MBT9330989.1 hypothetical protein [Paracidobacterium acidisoli]